MRTVGAAGWNAPTPRYTVHTSSASTGMDRPVAPRLGSDVTVRPLDGGRFHVGQRQTGYVTG